MSREVKLEGDDAETKESNPARLEYDFGVVVGRQGRSLRHSYVIKNHGDKDLRFARITNRKPCCGVIVSAGDIIAPGGTTSVDVILSIGGRFGRLEHEAVIEPEDPGLSPITLHTTADVIPAIRIEEGDVPKRLPSAGPEAVAGDEFRVVATGTDSDPPIALEEVTLASEVATRWSGDVVARDDVDGLRVLSRTFVALPRKGDKPGIRRAEITLKLGNQVIYTHHYSWEVKSPLEVFPKAFVLKKTGHDARTLIVRSLQNIPFAIMGVDGPESLKVSFDKSGRGAMHRIEIESSEAGKANQGTSRLIIRTDHPDLPAIELPIAFLGEPG
jgi:hypothetical protein